MQNGNKRDSVAVWFEIPAQDFERAVKFYEAALGTNLRREKYGESDMAVFPYKQPAISGCLMAGPNLKPSADGAIVYINCDGQLDAVAKRIETAGGRLVTPRIELPGDMGAFFQAIDSEGNRVGFHAVS